MLKFFGQRYFGQNAATVILPKGVIVADDVQNKLYLHDGATPGGIQVGGAGSVAGSLGYTPVNKAGDTMTGLFAELSATGLTAGTTLTQAGALALSAQINTITTSTAHASGPPFDGVKLPASAPGLEVEIINASANPIQIYGLGTDTLDGAAATTGLIQSPNSMVEYTCTATGSWVSEGMGVGYYIPSTNTVSASLYTESTTDNITAFATGGQANAKQLFSHTNRITNVTNPGDSVKLPPSAAGLEIVIINAGNNAVQVYGFGTDTVDGIASGTGVSQMKGSATIFFCATAGAWSTNGLATGYVGSFQTLSFADNLTAVTGGQGGTATIANLINKFGTVAAGFGCTLPAAAPGLSVIITNSGANALTVYGLGSDSINGVAAATGVTLMTNSSVVFNATATGSWIAAAIGTGYAGSLPTVSYTNNITAVAGGQSSATVLTACINRVVTIAAAGNGVALPVATPGLQITVSNAHASNSMNVYPANASGDQIDGLSAGTAKAVANGKTASFTCAATNNWHCILSA